MSIHAKISQTGHTWCFTSHYDQGDRASKGIDRGRVDTEPSLFLGCSRIENFTY
jgi:hypothetical protein